MKYLYITFSLFVFLSLITPAKAEIVTSKPVSFETTVGEIAKIHKTDLVRFEIKVEDITSPSQISYWKIRTYCDKDMSIQYSTSTDSVCGKAFNVKELASDKFYFFFENKTNASRSFFVKLKAYDKDGRWLHTEKESFKWD